MRLLGRAKRELRRVNRWLHPLTQEQVLAVLHGFGPLPTGCLMVHSALSACGYIRGGPAAVVAALLTWIDGRDLVMPTHTYCYPDASGQVPVYDPLSTPSRVGAVTDYFWRQPGVVRSLHPTHSLAVAGAGAAACAGHECCETPCGAGTPYQKLVVQDSSVLMLGVTLNAYTLFHTAEDEAGVPYLYEPTPYVLQTVAPDGRLLPVPLRRQDMSVPRRFTEMDRWLEQRGLLVRRTLGLGQLLFIPYAGAVHRVVVAALRTDPLLLVAEAARSQVAARFGL